MQRHKGLYPRKHYIKKQRHIQRNGSGDQVSAGKFPLMARHEGDSINKGASLNDIVHYHRNMPSTLLCPFISTRVHAKAQVFGLQDPSTRTQAQNS